MQKAWAHCRMPPEIFLYFQKVFSIFGLMLQQRLAFFLYVYYTLYITTYTVYI